MTRTTRILAAAGLAAIGTLGVARAEGPRAPLPPDAIVDLRTTAGASAVSAAWRYHDAGLVPAKHRAPGPDLKASGAPVDTHDLEPKAGVATFDDASWTAVAPEDLEARRGPGRFSAGWYRLHFTVPERIGAVATGGASIWFEIVADDYAEVVVDGRLPLVLGQDGGPAIAGWNTPNRVRVSASARPGEHHTIAVLVANGPLSDPPGNFVWIRSATLDVYAGGRDSSFERVPLEVTRRDPGLDAIVPDDAGLERVAGGFRFTEGPVWHPDGYLLFSDPDANVIYRWSPSDGTSIFRTKSGYAGVDIGRYRQPGSNGLALDPEGRLVIDEHGRRRVVRLERNGSITVLADRYEGKRLNSPNDVTVRSDGAVLFTDPPFGLPGFHDDPTRELPFTGVFCLVGGRLRVLDDTLAGPNGIAFSPDETFLYVGDWDPEHKIVVRYALRSDCSVADREVLYDMTDAPGEEAIDGIEVDAAGNLFVSGPGGLWILAPDGRHLGTLRGPEQPANMAWGDVDGKTLYLAARTGLYRIRLLTGAAPRASRRNP